MGRVELFSKINKRGGSNKSVDSGKNPKINKQASPFIRKARVQPHGHFKGVLGYFRVRYGSSNSKDNKKFRFLMTFDAPLEQDDQRYILTL